MWLRVIDLIMLMFEHLTVLERESVDEVVFVHDGDRERKRTVDDVRNLCDVGEQLAVQTDARRIELPFAAACDHTARYPIEVGVEEHRLVVLQEEPLGPDDVGVRADEC